MSTNLIRASSGGGITSVLWGSITGTLSDQTDLQTALNAKLTGSGPDGSVARWLSGALTSSTLYDDGVSAEATASFSVNANVGAGNFDVFSGTPGNYSFRVLTNIDQVVTRFNTLDSGGGGASLGGSIFTVGSLTNYGLGIQVAQNGPALIRIIQLDATLHDGIWSFDAEANALYWGTSSQNYAQILRDTNLGGVYQFNIMYGIIDSYQTMQVSGTSVGIRMPLGIAPVSMLDVAGNVTIGVNSAGVTAAPTGGLYVEGAVQFKNLITKYNNITTVKNGVPSELAAIDSNALTANVGVTTLYAVPSSGEGMYRVSAYLVTTTAASVSSTMPNAQVVYTDKDSNTSVTLDVSPILGAAGLGQTGLLTANTVGTVFSGIAVIYVKASTTIQYQTVNYGSTAAGMAYSLRIRLEAI